MWWSRLEPAAEGGNGGGKRVWDRRSEISKFGEITTVADRRLASVSCDGPFTSAASITTRVPMLGRLFRLSPLGTTSSIPFSQISPLARNPTTFSRPVRSFWTSSNLRQRYQYVRFGDPSGSAGSGGSGKGGGGRSNNPFESFWRRMSPGQKILVAGFGGGAPIFYFTHLETVEPTGRRRFIFMSRSMEEELGKMVLHLLKKGL